jgi:hypothetical protein
MTRPWRAETHATALPLTGSRDPGVPEINVQVALSEIPFILAAYKFIQIADRQNLQLALLPFIPQLMRHAIRFTGGLSAIHRDFTLPIEMKRSVEFL